MRARRATSARLTRRSRPAPRSPALHAIPRYMSRTEANVANEKAGTQSVKPVATAATATTPAPVVRTPAPKPVETAAAAPAPTPIHIAPVAPAPLANVTSVTGPAAPGSTYVQIAAVSHQEDANVLLSALQRRGYKVLARNDPADRLIHVQIGPFANRKDAEATRQKLLGDGYNAFLK